MEESNQIFIIKKPPCSDALGLAESTALKQMQLLPPQEDIVDRKTKKKIVIVMKT